MTSLRSYERSTASGIERLTRRSMFAKDDSDRTVAEDYPTEYSWRVQQASKTKQTNK